MISCQNSKDLSPGYREISAAIRARDTTISFEELDDKLLDHELLLRHKESKSIPIPITSATATINNYRPRQVPNNSVNNPTNGNQSSRYSNRTNHSSQWRP